MATSPLLGFDEMAVDQANKYLTFNEAVKLLEVVASGRVLSRTTTAEPGSPADGDAYILASSHTGTNWATLNQNDLVVRRGSEWVQVPPFEGLSFWVNDENETVTYNGSSWTVAVPTIDGDQLTSVGAANGDVIVADGANATAWIPGTTLFVGTVTSTDNAVARFNGTGGQVQNSGVLIDDSDNVDANGITFDSGSNILSHYSEGTWTPVISDANSGGNTGTYTLGSATYIRSGSTVHVAMDITAINTSGMTAGNIFYVQGLPFASAIQSSGSTVFEYTSIAGNVKPYVQGSFAFFRNGTNTGAAVNMIVSNLTSGSASLVMNLTYEV